MVSFRLPGVGRAGAVLLQAALWLLAAGLRRVRGWSTRCAPLRGGRTGDGADAESKPRERGRDPVRELLTEAACPQAPGGLRLYASL